MISVHIYDFLITGINKTNLVFALSMILKILVQLVSSMNQFSLQHKLVNIMFGAMVFRLGYRILSLEGLRKCCTVSL